MNEPKNHENTWSTSEVLKLKRLKNSKKTSYEISQEMGRTQEAILSKSDKKKNN